MCGRYYIADDEMEDMRALIMEAAQRADTLGVAMKGSGEIFPTNIVPAIGMDGHALPLQWGFARYDGKGQIINARSETAAEKGMFKGLLASSRCLIPASGYFEWAKEGAKKTKYALSLPTGSLYLAGLMRQERGASVPTFVILTKDAAPEISFIHDRMPVLFDAAAKAAWLQGDPAEALRLARADLRYAQA